MTGAEDQTAEPPVEGSSTAAPKTPWWRHQNAGVVAAAGVLIAWFSLTVVLLQGTKEDIAAVEAALKGDITAVETRLKNDITAAEGRLNTNIAGAETRLSDHLGRVESRLDRIMEMMVADDRVASTIEDQQEEVAGNN